MPRAYKFVVLSVNTRITEKTEIRYTFELFYV